MQAQRPADHRRDAAGPTAQSHIWFSFKRPNVIKFSMMQRKSLVRCGFPHFPSRLRNQSLLPAADTLSSLSLVCPALRRRRRTLICVLELLGRGPVWDPRAPPPSRPLTHLRGFTAAAPTAGLLTTEHARALGAGRPCGDSCCTGLPQRHTRVPRPPPRREASCNTLPRPPPHPSEQEALGVRILETLVQFYSPSVGNGASHSQGGARQPPHHLYHLCHLNVQPPPAPHESGRGGGEGREQRQPAQGAARTSVSSGLLVAPGLRGALSQ